jgi:hypothetical protein
LLWKGTTTLICGAVIAALTSRGADPCRRLCREA